MSEQNRDLEFTRILVALDASARGLAAMRAAAELAAGLRAQLEALFVEDINLLRLAELPFAREVGFSSALGRPLAFADLERALRAQAAQIERLLDDMTRRLHVPFHFRVMRGQVLAEVMAQAKDVDMLVFGKAGRPLHARWGAPEHPSRPVLAVYTGEQRDYRALAAALRLAGRGGRRLVVLVPESNPERYARLEVRAAEWLRRRGQAGARFKQVAGADWEAMAAALRGLRADALVLPSPKDDLSEEQLGALVDSVTCPVMLVR
jgi:nucleotide-binding universal stress UspA family protein